MEKTLGKILAEARAEHGFSLRELERRTGISNPMLSRIETGHVITPSFRTVVKIAAALKLSLNTLAKSA